MTNLTGKTAIISGGLGDIGFAVVRALAKAGAAVAVGDLHDPARAAQLLEPLVQSGSALHYRQVDVTCADAVDAWVADVEADLGIVQLVIPNAASVTAMDLLKIRPFEWDREIDVNLHGAFYLAQACAKRLVAENLPGRMVFLGSWAGHSAHSNIPAYCVSKAALRMLCQVFALRLAKHNILVNEVAPGFVDGGLSARLFERDPELRARTQDWVPVHKLITTTEVAEQVIHHADFANQHITGCTLTMDGGLTLTRVSNGDCAE